MLPIYMNTEWMVKGSFQGSSFCEVVGRTVSSHFAEKGSDTPRQGASRGQRVGGASLCCAQLLHLVLCSGFKEQVER